MLKLGNFVIHWEKVKSNDDSTIREHILFYNYSPDFKDFSVLITNSNDCKVTLMESLLIDRDIEITFTVNF